MKSITTKVAGAEVQGKIIEVVKFTHKQLAIVELTTGRVARVSLMNSKSRVWTFLNYV